MAQFRGKRRRPTYAEDFATEPWMQLHRKLIRFWRRKVTPEEHHGEEEWRLRRTGPEGRAVYRRRLRLVHFDPEEG